MLLSHTLTARGNHGASLVKFRPVVKDGRAETFTIYPSFFLKRGDNILVDNMTNICIICFPKWCCKCKRYRNGSAIIRIQITMFYCL